jgi:hypothetical protein
MAAAMSTVALHKAIFTIRRDTGGAQCEPFALAALGLR